jgi:hypothetical protein
VQLASPSDSFFTLRVKSMMAPSVSASMQTAWLHASGDQPIAVMSTPNA